MKQGYVVLMTKVNPYDGKFLHQSNNLVQESEMSFQSLAFKCWQVGRSWKLVVAIAGSM